MENHSGMETRRFSAFLSRLSVLCVCVCQRVVGGLWVVERWESLLSKESRTKQETIPLFWLVVATSVWNFEEVNSHVMLRSEHAHTNTNTSTHIHRRTQWRECLACLSKQRHVACEPPVDVMRRDWLNRLNTRRDGWVTLVESGLVFSVG